MPPVLDWHNMGLLGGIRQYNLNIRLLEIICIKFQGLLEIWNIQVITIIGLILDPANLKLKL